MSFKHLIEILNYGINYSLSLYIYQYVPEVLNIKLLTRLQTAPLKPCSNHQISFSHSAYHLDAQIFTTPVYKWILSIYKSIL